MIKTLIINDSLEIFKRLEGMVDWEKLGFSIRLLKGENNSLDEALKESFDFIIADINLPLSEFLSNMSDSILVILTRNGEFKFTKKAFKINACDYLLEDDLTEVNLIETLNKVKKTYGKKYDQNKNLLKYYREIQENKDLFKEKIIKHILNGEKISAEYIKEKKGIYDIVVPTNSVRFISLFVVGDFQDQVSKSYLDDQSIMVFSIINIMEEILDITVFFYKKAFIASLEGNISDIDINMKAELIKSTIKRLLNVNVSISIDKKRKNFFQLKEAYSEMKKLRNNYFYSSAGRIANLGDKVDFVTMGNSYNDFMENYKIRLNKHHSFLRFFENTLEEIKSKNYEPENVKKLMQELQSYIEERMFSIGIKYKKVKYNYNSFDLCKKNIMQIFSNYYDHFEKLDKVESNEDIIEVIKYVNENLENDISLDSAAKLIFKNPSYLSRLFKKHTGKTFTQYLIDGRIKRATYLLKETTLSISYICSQIGIENPHYFYTFYKRETGKSPSEVRK